MTYNIIYLYNITQLYLLYMHYTTTISNYNCSVFVSMHYGLINVNEFFILCLETIALNETASIS